VVSHIPKGDEVDVDAGEAEDNSRVIAVTVPVFFAAGKQDDSAAWEASLLLVPFFDDMMVSK
jgi:hypothetical protein